MFQILRNGRPVGKPLSTKGEAQAEIFIRKSNDAYRLLLGGRRKYRYEVVDGKLPARTN